MKKIGFIGLGNMGLPMASNLVKSGFSVVGFDIEDATVKKAQKKGIIAAKSAVETTENVDLLISMLQTSKQVEELYLSEAGILQKIQSKTLVIDCSTISPETTKKIALAAKNLGIAILDAPVSGGTEGAKHGKLTFIVGGAKKDFEKAKVVLSKMGKNMFHAGKNSFGQTAKLCNNMLAAILMCGTAETIALAVANGVDPKVISEIMRKSSGGNWALEVYNPYPQVMKNAPASKNYQNGFLSKLMLKDLLLAEKIKKRGNAQTPLGDLARKLYQKITAQGNGDLDFSVIQKNYL